MKMRRLYYVISMLFAVSAAVLYNSWVLGPILNPAASRRGLASELGAKGQPFNWVFIGGDVIAGTLLLTACLLTWLLIRKTKKSRYLGIALVLVSIFSVATIIDALLPMSCLPSLTQCPSWRVDHLLLAHGLVGFVASITLFVSLCMVLRRLQRKRLLAALLVGYLVFGLTSILTFNNPKFGNWSQHYYIALCSIWMAAVPLAVYAAAGFKLATQKDRDR